MTMSWNETITGARSGEVDACGVRTRYYTAGDDGPIAVLVHGGGAGADSVGNWRGVLALLAQNLRVYAIDMVGFGRSSKPDPAACPYTQQRRVEHVIATIEALGLERVNLVGNSMGGMTSMGVAIERPDLVDRVVLVGSAGIRTPMNEELESILNYDFSIDGMRRMVRGLTYPDFNVDMDLIEYRYARSIEPDSRTAYHAIMAWIGDRGGLYYPQDYIARLGRPALVVQGKLDRVVPLSSAYRLLELIDDSWGYILPRCGHWPMIEQTREFARATLDFLLP
ncbi:MAG: alpha/beta hydrolase [Gammaproteobacteria bacterium]|nr:alpha/beta hydrolase [Gammaproteobacteria bacterium]